MGSETSSTCGGSIFRKNQPSPKINRKYIEEHPKNWLDGYEFDAKYWGKKFYKLTNKKCEHRGVRYRYGKVVDILPFDYGGDRSIGLYFSDEQHIVNWLGKYTPAEPISNPRYYPNCCPKRKLHQYYPVPTPESQIKRTSPLH